MVRSKPRLSLTSHHRAPRPTTVPPNTSRLLLAWVSATSNSRSDGVHTSAALNSDALWAELRSRAQPMLLCTVKDSPTFQLIKPIKAFPVDCQEAPAGCCQAPLSFMPQLTSPNADSTFQASGTHFNAKPASPRTSSRGRGTV